MSGGEVFGVDVDCFSFSISEFPNCQMSEESQKSGLIFDVASRIGVQLIDYRAFGVEAPSVAVYAHSVNSRIRSFILLWVWVWAWSIWQRDPNCFFVHLELGQDPFYMGKNHPKNARILG